MNVNESKQSLESPLIIFRFPSPSLHITLRHIASHDVTRRRAAMTIKFIGSLFFPTGR